MQRYAKTVLRTMALGLVLSIGSYTIAFADEGAKKPLVIEEQGSFTVGGAYKERPGKFSQENFLAEDGQRAYGDFAYVEYQKPVLEVASHLPARRSAVETHLGIRP